MKYKPSSPNQPPNERDGHSAIAVSNMMYIFSGNVLEEDEKGLLYCYDFGKIEHKSQQGGTAF